MGDIDLTRGETMTKTRDVLLLIARIGIGVVFIAHGLQKLAIDGMSATAAGFVEMGVPLPTLSAWVAALIELLGGVSLILGLLLPVFGVLLAADMVGAGLIAHIGSGFFATDGGFEYVLVLALTSLALGFCGGRFALDRKLNPRAPVLRAATAG